MDERLLRCEDRGGGFVAIQRFYGLAPAGGTLTEADAEALFERAERGVAPFRDEFERERGSLGVEAHRGLSAIWTPRFHWPACARRFFNKAAGPAPDYGAELFPDQPNFTEALFGALAYHVEREAVLSLGGRLSEIGEQALGEKKLPLVLQERPDSAAGAQAVVADESLLGGVDRDVLESVLIAVAARPGGVTFSKGTPDAKRRQAVSVAFLVPAEISWDGADHRVSAAFTVRLPREGKTNLDSAALRFLGLTNGRPAQHYQDQAAAVIRLEEILFADPKSVHIVLDEGTPNAREIRPDKFFGKKLALLLTQTAGGFFERRFFQRAGERGVEVLQKAPSGGVVAPRWRSAETAAPDGSAKRDSILSYGDSPYRMEFEERRAALPGGSRAYELGVIRLAAPDGSRELVRVDFHSGDGRGLRDLGFFCSGEQRGRFKMSVGGEEGYSDGEFAVSPTRLLEGAGSGGGPAYYTCVTLRPRFPRDMAAKKIVLHVWHTAEGVYAETQVVPLRIVRPPEFEI